MMGNSFRKIIKPSTSIEVCGLYSTPYIILVVVQSSARSLPTESSGEGFMEHYRPNTQTQSVKTKNVLKEYHADVCDWYNESYY